MACETTGMRRRPQQTPPLNKRTYLVTRCVGRIASSRNEEIFNGSLGLLDSMQDRYRLESRGYNSR